MKEAITKFDLEAAFKALDEIDIPKAGKVKANRPALTEIFSHKTKFDTLMEEYYDVSSPAELEDAQEAREAEVAKAKLARIEKIVDLEADSPEDLLTSYVGKYIMQCPQCMTLFYKNPEDIVEDEEDPSTVNVNEVCQHCGNEAGYMLVGKVGEAEPGEFEPEMPELEATEEETPEEEPTEEGNEESTEEGELEDLGDLEDLDLNLEDEEEEKKEESFTAHEGEPLVEELADDKELDAKLEAHNEFIEYLRAAIAQEEEKLEKATNEQVKVAIQRNIDAFKSDLENALPDAVKNDITITPDEPAIEEPEAEEATAEAPEKQEESCEPANEGEALTESLHEEADLDVSAAEFEELINSPEFKKPISDAEARDMLNAEKESEESEEEVKEAVDTDVAENDESLEEGIFDLFKTRAGKAEWILKNAMIDYEKAYTNKNGDVETKKENQKYTCFVVVCYKGTYANGRKIDRAPMPDSINNMEVGVKYPDVKTKYADADKIAKGWSMKSDGGPAFIYLAKDANDQKAEFLCQYFNGKVDEATDRIDSIVEAIKNDMKGSKLRVKGGTDQSDTRKVKAEAIKPGMKVKLADGSEVEVTAVKKVTDALGDESYNITVTTAEGKKLPPFSKAAAYEFTVMRDSIKNESLEVVMSDLEDLQEAALESLISSSLVEAYGNVAGFRLAECGYADHKFTVDGTIYFTSGNSRKTTYTFNESYNEKDGRISLHGLNEKLGLDKQFTLTGRIENKTLITESFKRSK